jgi:hypothetical protein
MKRLPASLEEFLSPLGRRVAALQRRLPRPSRRRVARFQPVSVGKDGPLLTVMCEPRTRWDALWAMWSALRFLVPNASAAIFVDGMFDPGWAAVARRLFPGIQLHSALPWLAAHDNPLAKFPTFLATHGFARKLAVVTALQREHDLIFADADVLVFSDPVALRAALQDRRPQFLLDPARPAYDPWLKARADALGLPCEVHLNSGLMNIPRNSVDDALLGRLLADWSSAHQHRFTEQTIFGVLLPLAGGTALPREQYVVSSHGMYFWHDDISYAGVVARHFVGTVRHLMYTTGFDHLLATAPLERSRDGH